MENLVKSRNPYYHQQLLMFRIRLCIIDSLKDQMINTIAYSDLFLCQYLNKDSRFPEVHYFPL